MSLPPSAMGARSRDPEPSEPHGPGPRVKICSWSCLSWLHPLRSWSLRQTRGGSVCELNHILAHIFRRGPNTCPGVAAADSGGLKAAKSTTRTDAFGTKAQANGLHSQDV